MTGKIKFVLEDVPAERTGIPTPTLIKKEEGKPDDPWCTVADLDLLFATAAERWPDGFDLAKIQAAVREAEFD